MEIRPDFKEVDVLINRLITYQKEFAAYNRERWSYLKNKEDFSKVYDLENTIRIPLEEVYSNGRDLAVSMSYLLTEFNDIGAYPTFVSYVDNVERTTKRLLHNSEGVINKAEQTILEIENCPYAVEKMIFLYKMQVNILEGIENWISRAKNTKLYKEESGEINQFSGSTTMDRANIYQYSTTFHGPVGQAQVQQATKSSTQSMESSKLDYKKLLDFMSMLKESIEQVKIPNEIRDELYSEITTIEAQANSPKPKNSIISESLNTIRRILEGAGGHIAAKFLLQIGNLFV